MNAFLRITLLIAVIGALFAGAFGVPGIVAAQEEIDESAPVNLSMSGAAVDPLLVADPQGGLHAIWLDEFDGRMVSRFDEGAWSAPRWVSLPFGSHQPKLLADARGYVHAVWIEADGSLYYSRVAADGMERGSNWLDARPVAENAVSFDLVTGKRGELHLLYVRSLSSGDYPAGVYYRRSKDNGDNWYPAVALYHSPYLRSGEDGVGDKGQGISASVSLAWSNAGEGTIYAAWDNPRRKQVWLARSVSSGASWEDAVLVDSPAGGLGSAEPQHPVLGAQAETALLLWNTAGATQGCRTVYQVTADAGETWAPATDALDSTSGCGQVQKIIPLAEGRFYLAATTGTGLISTFWDGTRWLDAESEPLAASFQDTETKDTVTLGCQALALTAGGRLGMAGCDTSGGGDVWYVSRMLELTAEDEPAAPVWNGPLLVGQGNNISGLVMAAGDQGNYHALWSQENSDQKLFGVVQTAIFYARWDGKSWSRPQAVLKTAEGAANSPAVALDGSGYLYAAWTAGQAGNLYFSMVRAGQAMIPIEWATPGLVPTGAQLASSPVLLLSPGATGELEITIVYSAPINEGRGIYSVKSVDRGATWSSPVVIFNAAAAGWEMVSRPKLAFTHNQDGSDMMHLMWSRQSFEGLSGEAGLYYARSDDGGQNWGETDTVTGKQVVWGEIFADGNYVHRIWQEGNHGSGLMRHQVSMDGGQTWTRPEGIAMFGGQVELAELDLAPDGRLHLLAVILDTLNQLSLRHWVWDQERWGELEKLSLPSVVQTVDSLAAAVSPQGRLEAILAAHVPSLAGEQSSDQSVLAVGRSLDLIPSTQTPEPSNIVEPLLTETPVPIVVGLNPTGAAALASATAEPAALATATPTPEPTPTPDLSYNPGKGLPLGPLEGLGKYAAAAASVILAVALVGAAFGVRFWVARGKGF